MFKKELQEKLKNIFGIERMTFDLPSDSYEQDKLFIEIASNNGKVGGGLAKFRVEGSVFMFGKNEKIPYGFYSRKIAKAEAKDLNGFFFFNESTPPNAQSRLLDLIESRISFRFLYKAEIDPNQGELTSVEGI